MSYRHLGTTVTFLAVMTMAPPFAAAQTTDAAATPRTAWGAADLGGVWDFRTTTPLERPDEFSEKEELTSEFDASLEKAKEERDQRVEVRDRQMGIQVTEEQILQTVDLKKLDLKDK